MGAVVHLLFLFCFILFQERAKFYITADNIDRAIEDALASPVDHNYAIDLEGHIYRGHKTKPSDVPPEELEKIQVQEQISWSFNLCDPTASSQIIETKYTIGGS